MKILIYDNGYKKYTTEWVSVSGANKDMFDTHGMNSISAIPDSAFALLGSNFSIHVLNDINVSVSSTAVPTDKTVIASGDILFNKKEITAVEITATNCKYIISKDSGVTWYTWNGNSFVQTVLEDIETEGIDESIPAVSWDAFLVDKVRFAYRLSQTDSTDVSSSDLVRITMDLNGYYETCSPDMFYANNTHLKIMFTENGTYKINY